MSPTSLVLYAITNEKTVKLMQIDRIPAASCDSPLKHVPITLVGIPQGLYNNRYTPTRVVGTCFSGESLRGGQQPIDLR